MKYISLLSLLIIVSICNAQTSTTKVQKSGTTTTNPTNNAVKNSTSTAKKFSFLGSYTIKFTTKDAKGKATSTGEIKSAYDEFKMASIPIFSTEKETILRTIFDVKANTMTMLIDDIKKKKKTGLIMKMPKIAVVAKTETTTVTASIQKTTETKIIDGYKCVKWIITYSDGAKCESWITKDITINSAEAISYFTAGRKGKKSPINTDCANINGCALESAYTAKDGSSVFMKMTEIKKEKPNVSFFSSNGYELTDVTGIEFFK